MSNPLSATSSKDMGVIFQNEPRPNCHSNWSRAIHESTSPAREMPICTALSSVLQGLWMNSATLFTMAIGPGSVSRYHPKITHRTFVWLTFFSLLELHLQYLTFILRENYISLAATLAGLLTYMYSSFMDTILTKVVLGYLKACQRFAWHSNK